MKKKSLNGDMNN